MNNIINSGKSANQRAIAKCNRVLLLFVNLFYGKYGKVVAVSGCALSCGDTVQAFCIACINHLKQKSFKALIFTLPRYKIINLTKYLLLKPRFAIPLVHVHLIDFILPTSILKPTLFVELFYV